MNRLRKEFPTVSVGTLCQLFGLSRQAYYKAEKRASKRGLQEALVLQKVRKIKEEQPQLGTEKVYLLIKPFLAEHCIKWGAISSMSCCVRIVYYPKENEEDPVLRSLNTAFTSIQT